MKYRTGDLIVHGRGHIPAYHNAGTYGIISGVRDDQYDIVWFYNGRAHWSSMAARIDDNPDVRLLLRQEKFER